MIAFDVSVEIIFHLEQSITVSAFEHVGFVEFLVYCAHVIFHAVQAGEGFKAEFALGYAVSGTEMKNTFKLCNLYCANQQLTSYQNL